jgi:hypothetical protein
MTLDAGAQAVRNSLRHAFRPLIARKQPGLRPRPVTRTPGGPAGCLAAAEAPQGSPTGAAWAVATGAALPRACGRRQAPPPLNLLPQACRRPLPKRQRGPHPRGVRAPARAAAHSAPAGAGCTAIGGHWAAARGAAHRWLRPWPHQQRAPRRCPLRKTLQILLTAPPLAPAHAQGRAARHGSACSHTAHLPCFLSRDVRVL